MGIAAYNRGSRSISRQIYGDDTPARPTPRPAGWGEATRAAAEKKARGLLEYWMSRGHEKPTVEELAWMVRADTKWGTETCNKAAEKAHLFVTYNEEG